MNKGIWISDKKFLSFAEIEKDISGQVATRSNAARYFGHFFSVLPDPDEVLAKIGRAVETYNKMEYDPHIFAEIEKRKALTTSLTFDIVQGKADTKKFEFIKDYFLSNDHELFDQLNLKEDDDEDSDIYDLLEVGLDAIFHGYQPVEIVWELINGIRLPVKLIDRPREWFHFDTDNRLRFKSKANSVDGELLPEKKFLLFRHKPRYNNPYGTRVLSRCFWPWMFKHSTEKWKIQFLEKFGTVWALGKLPRGKENKEYDNMYDALLDLINSAVGVVPDDGSVELIEPAGKGTTANIFDGNIKLYNDEISKAIVTVTSLTDSDSKGSYASDEIRERMLKALTSSDKKIALKKTSQLFRWVFDVNGWGSAPTAELWEPEDYDKERADRDQILHNQGLRPTKKYYISKYGFEEDDFELTGSPPLSLPRRGVGGEVELAEGEVDELKILVNSIPSNTLQGLIEPVIKQVLKAFDESTNFEEAMEKVIELIPAANTDEIEEFLTRARFTAFAKGSIDAG